MSIIVKSLSYIHPDKDSLFTNISFSVSKGQKVALVGNNGTGKSTILRIIAGHLHPLEGEVILSEKPYYVPQHLGQYDNYSISQVLEVEEKLHALHAILNGDVSPDNLKLLDDDWGIEERVNAALSFWNIRHLKLSLPMGELSGGEKTKVFLSGIFIYSPRIILLDEPTNHLDSESRAILYDFIKKSKSAILAVSHDRTLLNLLEVTLELNKNEIEVYGGNYDAYKAQKAVKLLALQSQLEEREKMLKQTQQKARDITEQCQKKEARGKAQKPKMALPRIVSGSLKSKAEQSSAKLMDAQNEKINDLSENLKQIRQQVQEQKALKIDLRKSELHKGKILIDAKDINFSYTEELLWESPLTFQIRSGDRIRIEGNNGAGKTTLIKIVTGNVQPLQGEICIADFQYLYIDQEYSMLERQLSVFEQVQKFNDRHLLEHELKMLLHYHQFSREVWDRKCEALSGGEKMKLILCCVAVCNNTPDLLILDEPTNNLDMLSQEILTESVKAFTGSILVISHDQYFINDIHVHKNITL
ncbi:MAG: ATP-binding cassette domain-containing protein [Mediterranea sp.]|jgi:ATPase subunit of ABC transporter with duplicated ATPase domains|nr:ATP-binding cassette domain-containing protein [Mediterranea sp.]